MATVFDVANWFLAKSSMTHKKLQKLCYYAQAWSYALYSRPLFDDVFEAWVHGPVCRSLYNHYRERSFEVIHPTVPAPEFSTEDDELLESVWETYGELTANALEALTHSELPWQIARAGCDSGEPCCVVIDSNDMAEFYRSIYTGGDA